MPTIDAYINGLRARIVELEGEKRILATLVEKLEEEEPDETDEPCHCDACMAGGVSQSEYAELEHLLPYDDLLIALKLPQNIDTVYVAEKLETLLCH